MKIEMTPAEQAAYRYNWMRASALRQWCVKTFGIRMCRERTKHSVLTYYLFGTKVYGRSEQFSQPRDPMPPFSPDYVEGGRKK